MGVQIKREHPESAQKTVIVVDDHPIVREGITQLLSQQPDLRVIGDAVDIASARRAVRELTPDVAVLDISLGGESGLDLIPLLLEDAPDLAILALSMHDEGLYAKRALQVGARGYIMNHEGTDLLLQAIRTVMAGQIYVSARMNASLLRSITGGKAQRQVTPRGVLAELSNRELQIYRLVGNGLATKEIASQLFVSAKTVESHRARIRQKLGLDTAAALVAHAAEWLIRSSHALEPSGAVTDTPETHARRE
jgi:DNA-binding NarL/FixJ family response regulator